MHRVLRGLGLTLASASLAALLGVHAYMGTFSRYIADDFCSAGIASRLGLPRAVWYWYLNWTGRFSASVFDAASGLIGPGLTPFLPALAILAWMLVATHLLTATLRPGRGHGVPAAALAAATLIYVTLRMSPNVPQTLYWGQGLRSVLPPLILGALLVDVFMRNSGGTRPRATGFSMAIVFLLAFISGGFNETYSVLQVGMLASAIARLVAARPSNSRGEPMRLLTVAMVGAVISLLVVAASPGNAVRQAFYPSPPNAVQILTIAWENFATFLVRSWTEPAIVLGVLGSAGLAIYIGMGTQARATRPLVIPAVLMGGLLLAFCTFLPAAYALSEAPPDRTLLIPAHLLAISMFMACIYLGMWLAPRTGGEDRCRTLQSLSILAGAAMLIASSSITIAHIRRDLPHYRAYAEHWHAVDSEIRQARELGQSEVWIHPMRNWAGLDEPNDNPKYWVNECMSRYYGIPVFGFDLP